MPDLTAHLSTLLLVVLAGSASSAPLDGAVAPAPGQALFESQCAKCHSLTPGKRKRGPSLFAVIDRRAGTELDYRYSTALKDSNFLWTDERLDAYITSPKTTIPGGKMKYKGLPDPTERAQLIEYLRSIR